MRWPWNRTSREEDLRRELQSDLDLEAEERRAAGLAPQEARYAARRSLGNPALVAEDVRESWGWMWLERLRQDLRYGLRMLRKNPGFTTVAVACLALGIGGSTAIFSLMNAILLKSLPVKSPEQLVLLRYVQKKTLPPALSHSDSGYGGMSLPYGLYQRIRQNNTVLSHAFAFVPLGFDNQSVATRFGGQIGTAGGEMVSGDYFAGLGVTTILGRPIVDEDLAPGAAGVTVLSYGYWSRQFGRNPMVLGKTIHLNRIPHTIIGVAQPEFYGVNAAAAPDFWIPMREQAGLTPWGVQPPGGGESMFTTRNWWWCMLMGRRKPNVSVERANAELNALFQSDLVEGLASPPKPEDLPRLEPRAANQGIASLRRRFSRPLYVLLTAVGLLLLIACANVATLLLARGTARQREMSVRLATGASRVRLLRQLVTESLLLSVLGGALGLGVAEWGARALLALLSQPGQNIAIDARLDPTVLGFSLGLCILTGALFGILPAFRATRVDLTNVLKEATRGSSPRLRLAKVLIAGQVAFSLVLVMGAGLFIRTLRNLQTQDLGFNQRDVLLFALDPRRGGAGESDRLLAIYRQVLEGLQAQPGVRAATASQLALMTGWVNNGPITTDGPALKSGESNLAFWNSVGPAFFETMGMRVKLGRGIDWRDLDGKRNVAVINEALAKHFLPGLNPLGHRFNFGDKRSLENDLEIVGIIADAKYASLRDEPPRTFYVPYSLSGRGLGRMFFEVRAAGDPRALIPVVRAVVGKVDPELALIGLKTQSDQVEESLGQERMFARLCGFFGGAALLLVAIGLYGALAYTVTRRTNEIGIRMALGARRGGVVWTVLRESLVLIVCGVAAGIPVALATTRLVASQLYNVRPSDPATIVAAMLILGAVGALAGFVPARRASRVDPMVALRYE
jgi:macrolide transport system ATP-binding/permease protein